MLTIILAISFRIIMNATAKIAKETGEDFDIDASDFGCAVLITLFMDFILLAIAFLVLGELL